MRRDGGVFALRRDGGVFPPATARASPFNSASAPRSEARTSGIGDVAVSDTGGFASAASASCCATRARPSAAAARRSAAAQRSFASVAVRSASNNRASAS